MSKGKILVVDDEPDIVEVVKARLQLAGYEVLTASRGEETLARSLKEKPDLVILDIMMPGMDGFEVLRRLREGAETKFIPVIFLTAKTSLEDRMTGLVGGGAAYLCKPFKGKELVEKVETVFHARKGE